MIEPMLWSFLYFYHTDKANACLHCAPVRFSPVTFRLMEALFTAWPDAEDVTTEMAEVRRHSGAYKEDAGR